MQKNLSYFAFFNHLLYMKANVCNLFFSFCDEKTDFIKLFENTTILYSEHYSNDRK